MTGGLAIFGGAFDPFHLGHLGIVDHLLTLDYIHQILLIPTFIPSHKALTSLSFSHRFEMLFNHFEAVPSVSVLDIEAERGTPSWTIDTLEELEEVYPEETLYLVLGSDSLLSFHTWKAYREIFRKGRLMVINRQGVSQKMVNDYLLKIFGSEGVSRVTFMTPLIPSISSSQIRESLKQGRSISSLVPSWVETYLFKHGLSKPSL